jgi:hypothetical protein
MVTFTVACALISLMIAGAGTPQSFRVHAPPDGFDRLT